MSEELIGNVLILQSGNPVAISNAILAGIVTESLNYDTIEEIYGCLNGIAGILNEDFIDLAEESQQTIRGLRHTPGAALGSREYDLKEEDFDRIIKVFEAQNIRFLFVVGNIQAQKSADLISKTAKDKGYDVRVIGIPHSIDNTIPVTDHSLGYGSAIKYISTSVQEIALTSASTGRHDLVSIIEVSGGKTGWLTAGATLGRHRNKPAEAPHIICLPETPFSTPQFIESVQATLKSLNYCVVVTAESLFDSDGNLISVDKMAGREINTSDFLKGILEDSLGAKVETCKLGTAQSAAAHCGSKIDQDEAKLCGEKAVAASVNDGITGKMVTVMRAATDSYTAETSLISFDEISEEPKAFPTDWIEDNITSLRHQFFKYALPLIQGETEVLFENGIAKFASLSKNRVEKKLESYALT